MIDLPGPRPAAWDSTYADESVIDAPNPVIVW